MTEKRPCCMIEYSLITNQSQVWRTQLTRPMIVALFRKTRVEEYAHTIKNSSCADTITVLLLGFLAMRV